MSSRLRERRTALRVVGALVVLGLGLIAAFAASSSAGPSFAPTIAKGSKVQPAVFDGSVRALPRPAPGAAEVFHAPGERGDQDVDPYSGPKQTLPGAGQPAPPAAPVTSAPAPDPTISFKGLDKATWGDGTPPDTVGDVGPTHFVQAVNTSVGIFRKSDGNLLAAFKFNALWAGAGTGTVCDTINHRGDPTVVYDPLGDRWIVADFAFVGNGTAPPFFECIAVSKTGDPVAGRWYLYAVRTDDGAHPYFADYPKMGIWPDGLYMTANMFQGSAFREVRVWAFNRDDLESGAPLRSVVMDLNTTNYFSLLPSNMRSATGAPPAGRENLLVTESESIFGFELFKFHVDYSGSGSTLTGPASVSQAAYTPSPATVPTPANSVDSISDRLMMQAQYTNIGGAESLWVNHTAGFPAGIQWAEINVTGGTVSSAPVQQQLYAPGDGLYRWLGSLAVDKRGDMALGYSLANGSVNPDIVYAGRLASDPLGTLPQTETSLLAGVSRASQFGQCGSGGPCSRWGDYSAMTLDPDGCRFWYTNEYYEATGLNWQTRIGSFSFPSCFKTDQAITFGPLPNRTFGDTDFTVSASASSGLQVSFTSSGNCVVSGATVHITGAGSCTIAASQPGDGTFTAASASQAFTIAKAAQTITFAPVTAKRWGDADFSVGATASSGLPVTLVTGGSCSVAAPTMVHVDAAGRCMVTASQGGDANYNAALDASETITIAKARQRITFPTLRKRTFGAVDFHVTAKASSGLPVHLTARGRCTISHGRVHLTGPGLCAVRAAQPGNADFDAATSVSHRFVVAPPPCRVPPLVGKKIAAARTRIAARGCRTGRVSYASSGTIGEGRVASQSRPAGRKLPAGSKIDLVVSSGPGR